MPSTARQPSAPWPKVTAFRNHWEWRPDWTSNRPRLLWYLTFEDAPDLHDAAAPSCEVLRASGADVVPPEWFHLTVTDVGYHDQLDDWAVRAARESVRETLCEVPALELTLGPLRALPGAIVLPAEPADPLRSLRDAVRRATTAVGIAPPDDLSGSYWPHVSLCYVNDTTDHARLREIVDEAASRTVDVRCDRLAQVLVTRTNGHYRWEVLDEVPLERASDRVPVPAQAAINLPRQS